MAISGNVPLTVEFSDTSTGDNLTYLWDFGDGQKSTEQNPNHEYAASGQYRVTLTTTNNYGSDTKSDIVTATSTTGKDGDYSGGRDTGGFDPGGRDTGGRDTGGFDPGGRDTGGRDTDGFDPDGRGGR